MSDSVLVVCPDKDFSGALAEQVKAELGLACVVAQEFRQADMAAASVVVTTEAVPPEVACPVVTVRGKKLRMRALLSEIAQSRVVAGDDVAIGAGYVLKLRPKQLARGQGSIDLTDKEVAIIQQLAASGAEGVSKEQLLKDVWGFDSPLDTHTLETHIYRLRNKIRELGRDQSGDEGLISATPGGYALAIK